MEWNELEIEWKILEMEQAYNKYGNGAEQKVNQ